MNYKNLVKQLGFTPKSNEIDIYIKSYSEGYVIQVDFDKEKIDYGKKIKSESKTTLNFSQPENFVVLECVDRLLNKGYKPENIILEKTWGAGHGTSGRLDICVTRKDGSEYLLIECKLPGKEFEKEFTRMKKDGGQLFTYFKFSNKADVIMLYTSELKGNDLIYRNEIVKIDDDYRLGDVKDFYEKWNKLTKDNGVFENWVTPYNFVSKALTSEMLEPIKQEDSSFIFNRFLEILRHNVVSDKPNAFNKIFTLFLCKIYDEKINEGTDNELDFQWKEGIDDDVSFQLRLTDLYKNGMYEFLEKRVTDFSETEFEKKYNQLDENVRALLLSEFKKIRLEKNNEFAIKEVYDEKSFKENAKVVKEVVELLQGYKIRYTKKQQYLSDFFELLLTTGLKQESGQFFTPVPIAQFIIRSIPIDEIVEQKLKNGKKDDLLPYIMDYAAGSGHFLTESMHEIQRQIDSKNNKLYHPETSKKIRNWQDDHFEWALQYVYGIEKDYRLVKVGKVGCYLHGDGLANVIHSDGLSKFSHSDYKGKLSINDSTFSVDNKQFDVIISNPPYSVSAFKNNSREYYKEEDFELYKYLTDNSSEIECLFVERTKQLLKDGGVAGIILPSSILSNTGIYAKTRGLILEFFDIIGFTELGSNTFMATGSNTTVLFLKRKDNYHSINLKTALNNFKSKLRDVSLNGIEKPIEKYIKYVWKTISFSDYVSLFNKKANDILKAHPIYKDYEDNLKYKNESEFFETIISIELDKIFYFILAYPQKVIIVKTGEKDEEKRFLGYEFSYRRGSEGIHSINRSKSIEECTKLFDPNSFENVEKASTYIYSAFKGDFSLKIHPSLEKNVSYCNLLDLMTFDRIDFEKTINLSVKKKIEIKSKFSNSRLSEILKILESGKRPKGGVNEYQSGVPSLGGEHINPNGSVNLDNMKFVPESFYKNAKQGIVLDKDILICKDGALTGKVALFNNETFPYPLAMINEHVFRLRVNENNSQEFLFYFLASSYGQELLKSKVTGTAQGGLNRDNLLSITIPVPDINTQNKIAKNLSKIQKQIEELSAEIKSNNLAIYDLIKIGNKKEYKFANVATLEYGKSLHKSDRVEGDYLVMGSNGIVGNHNKYIVEAPCIIVGRKGSAGKVNFVEKNCYPIDTTFYVKLEESLIHVKYFYYVLSGLNLENLAKGKGIGVPGLNRNDVHNLKLYLHNIEDQVEIVKEIEINENKILKCKNKIESLLMEKESNLLAALI